MAENPKVNFLNSVDGDTAQRSIGTILVESGRLNPGDTERIRATQKKKGLRFGDAAVRLGLIKREDVQFALSRQFDYPYLERGRSNVSEEVIAAYNPFAPQVEALRGLRSQLMLHWFRAEPRRKALAIVSPGAGEGRSWLAANLAVVFSQLGERTLLIDADLRKPRQHALFGVDNRAGLSAVLSSRAGGEAIQEVPELNLSVLPAGAIPPNPQELLSRPPLARQIREIGPDYDMLGADFDIILVDTPAAARFADAQTVAARAGGALLLARRHASRAAHIQAYVDMLTQAGTRIAGMVMNEY